MTSFIKDKFALERNPLYHASIYVRFQKNVWQPFPRKICSERQDDTLQTFGENLIFNNQILMTFMVCASQTILVFNFFGIEGEENGPRPC